MKTTEELKARTKFLGYAYPSSGFAVKLGYGKSGCWYLALTDDGKHGDMDIVYSAEKREDVETMIPYVLPAALAWDNYSFKPSGVLNKGE